LKGFGKAVRDELDEAGCTFVRHGRGDHDIWHSPINGRNFTVPVNIMSRHMANKIMRDAGLPKAF
jgi:predicted RNA binding protein YcfA (HicA-like mRNA interferase family)